MAQFTMALLLEVGIKGQDACRGCQTGPVVGQSDFCFWNGPLMELNGKTMGIIGFGAISRSVAKPEAFGMEVLACRRTPDRISGKRACPWASLEEIYQRDQ